MNPHSTRGLARAARRVGLGTLKLYAYHRPVGLVRKSISEGGPLEQRRTERGRREMIDAAQRLPPFARPAEDFGARVHLLTGRLFWYQTVFCFASLQSRVPFAVTPVVFDDGSLDAETRSHIARVVPWAEFVGKEAIAQRLDAFLPADRFPSLRHRRVEYLHLRKLTDLHAGQHGWSLVLDSDMLFFRCPDRITQWFRAPAAVYMQDIGDAYGYTPALMAELAEGPVLPRVNVGLYGLDRSRIDWDLVEAWCARQIEREQRHYLQEQALTALILGRQGAVPLPADDYRVLPSLDEGEHPTAVLHHYVAHTKRSYFQHGWRRIARQIGAAA